MRILHETDRAELIRYVKMEPEMNLFLLGDIENFGVESKEVTIWLHEEQNRWDFIILRFFQYYLLYSQYEDYNADEAVCFLRTREPKCISGKTALLERIAGSFPQWKIESTYMSRCDKVEGICGLPPELSVRRLNEEDVPAVIDLLSDVEEFRHTYPKEDRLTQISIMQKELERGSKVLMGGFVGNQLAATAATSAENSESAMVVAVAAKEEFRGKGYASAVVSALCADGFQRGKKYLCLFYDNPVAGRIYRRIGFREMGRYGMLR